jgi:hypothetical protein
MAVPNIRPAKELGDGWTFVFSDVRPLTAIGPQAMVLFKGRGYVANLKECGCPKEIIARIKNENSALYARCSQFYHEWCRKWRATQDKTANTYVIEITG